jgi:threonyl-tRNA synthetase
MSYSIHNIRYHYLPLVAKALKGLFPRVKLVGGGLSDHGFYYDAVIEGGVVDSDAMRLVEDRMLELFREGVEFSFVEMMRDVAVNYLLHHQQKEKAHILKDCYSSGLMSFLKVDEFIEPVPENFEAMVSEQLKHFQLLEVSQFPVENGGIVTRFEGTAFLSSKELKRFKKKKKTFVGYDHQTLAQDMKLYAFDSSNGEGVWLPRGVDWLKIFFNRWQVYCSELNVNEIKTGAVSEREFFEKSFLADSYADSGNVSCFGEILALERDIPLEECNGMWKLKKYLTDRTCCFVEWSEVQQALISSLQSIMKTVKMLGSDCCWVISSPTTNSSKKRSVMELEKALTTCHIPYVTEVTESEDGSEPRAYCTIPDGLGKYWKGPFVGVNSSKLDESPRVVVSCSLFGSVERMVASLLEHYRGNIPFVFTPEQIRLVTMSNQSVYAEEVYRMLKDQGYRVKVDRRDTKLAEKIHSAEKEKIPFIAVIGENESKKHVVTLRKSVASNKQRSVTINDLLDELHRENSEKNFWSL